MRSLALLALPGLLLLSGCLSSTGDIAEATGGSPACAASTDLKLSATTQILLSGDVPASQRAPAGNLPEVSVHAQAGQHILAIATWSAGTGNADVQWSGPEGQVTSTPGAWTWTGAVPAGDYTLDLVGTPLATGVVFSLVLESFGCPT